MNENELAPCGQMIGHGERCSVGWLCENCQDNLRLVARVAEIVRSHLKLEQKNGKLKDKIT